LLSIIIYSSFVYASNEDIIVNYPSTVNYGETFILNLTILNPSSEMYHIKIDIINLTGSRISKIYDNGVWKSSNYYIYNSTNTSITNSTLFNMNITTIYNGTATMSITLKKGTTTLSDFGPYNLSVNYIPPTPINQTQNSSSDPINNTTQDSSPSIYLKLDYDNEIENGNDFDVKVKAYNLEDKDYDIKVYLTKENSEDIISETYINKTWKSSNYYYEDIISGIGNKTKTLSLRIDSDYLSFEGDAKIKVRIRENGESSSLAYSEEDISIIEKKAENLTKVVLPQINHSIIQSNVSEEIIRLNSIKEDLKTISSKIYLSRTEYVKGKAIYIFALFCVLIIAYVIINK
jgi:hypothetical protein